MGLRKNTSFSTTASKYLNVDNNHKINKTRRAQKSTGLLFLQENIESTTL